jgi:hypothetical protein
MRSFFALALVLSAPVLAGCTVEPEPGIEAGALSGSVGVLHVERSGVAGRTVLRAAFARYQGVEGDSVLSLLGSRSPAELGMCSLVDANEDAIAGNASSFESQVELLDVGALSVSLADAETRLSPSTFPDLASVLVGVFYAGDAALPLPEAEVDEYRFQAEGGVEVGAFDVVVPAPAEPSGLALIGADGTSAALDGRLTEIGRTGALELTWDGEDPRDYIEIEIEAAGQTLACSARDVGALRIAHEELALLEADAQARLVVRRVRISPFDAAGMDVAFARITAVRTIPLAVQ